MSNRLVRMLRGQFDYGWNPPHKDHCIHEGPGQKHFPDGYREAGDAHREVASDMWLDQVVFPQPPEAGGGDPNSFEAQMAAEHKRQHVEYNKAVERAKRVARKFEVSEENVTGKRTGPLRGWNPDEGE